MRAGGGIKALIQQGGGKALYAGVGGNLVGVVPSSALFMAVYEPVKQAIMGRVPEEKSYLGPIGGGAAAGLVSSAIRVPTEVIKQRMQTGMDGMGVLQCVCVCFVCVVFVFRHNVLSLFPCAVYTKPTNINTKYKNKTCTNENEKPPPPHPPPSPPPPTGEFTRAVQAIRTIVAREGARGLYAGYGSFLLRDLPFDAIEFVVYEQLKRAVKITKKGVDPTPLETSAIGATAGAVTGLVTTPLDVIKTRLMIQGTNKTYKGVLDCAGQIIQQEGSGALFRVGDCLGVCEWVWVGRVCIFRDVFVVLGGVYHEHEH